MSARVAPSASSRSTSASRSSGRKSRCSRFLEVFCSGTGTNRSPGRRSAAGRISNSSGSSLTTTQPSASRHQPPKRAGVARLDDRLLPLKDHWTSLEGPSGRSAPYQRRVAARSFSGRQGNRWPLLSAITNHARLSVERMDPTGMNDRALVERYDALRADLDRTRDMDKRLALHRELQNLASERQRRHPLAITPLRS